MIKIVYYRKIKLLKNIKIKLLNIQLIMIIQVVEEFGNRQRYKLMIKSNRNTNIH
jgi:hypothetical protein